MKYYAQEPAPGLENRVVSFWMLEDGNKTPQRKKIVPDGYPEIIFHFRDPYRIRLGKRWELQESALFAGQIKNHFYLENTGLSGVFGIKVFPTFLASTFDLNMGMLTHKVSPFIPSDYPMLNEVQAIACSAGSFQEKTERIERLFRKLTVDQDYQVSLATQAVSYINSKNGLVTVREVVEKLGISERSLERQFKMQVGLTPKLFSRIIRFSYIFQLIKHKKVPWTELAYLSGYYDQPHFIKNFKEFTGEEPSKYGFDQENLANFFMFR